MSTNNDNYYEFLGISRDASLDAIRASYRRKMQKLRIHPDLGGDNATAALLNKAYAVLCDPESRSDYDARLEILGRVAQGFADRGLNTTTIIEEFAQVLDPNKECLFCETPHSGNVGAEADATCGNCSSPLTPADNLRIEPHGQRAVERFEKELPVLFFSHWRQPKGFAGRTEDISLNGMRLVTTRRLKAGQRIRITSSVLEAIGRVTHCNARAVGWREEQVAGIAFLTLRFSRTTGGFVSQQA